MSDDNTGIKLSHQQQQWLAEFCRLNGLEADVEENSLGVEFQTDEITVGIYPLADENVMLFNAEVLEFTDVDALQNPELLLLLHRLNGLNLADSDHVVVIDDQMLSISARVRLTDFRAHDGADLIAGIMERAEAVKALFDAAEATEEEASEETESQEDSPTDQVFG